MKIRYFESTDTLCIELDGSKIAESKDLGDNTVLDLDSDGNVCVITFEHASARTDVQEVTLEGIAA